MNQRDRVYRDPKHQIVDFAFDEAVANVFGDMIRRSVPGYETVVPISGLLAARHLAGLPEARRVLYDLGCSLAASTHAVLRETSDPLLKAYAVDDSAAMLEHAQESLHDSRVTFVCTNITDLSLQPAGVVMLNFVLQFVQPSQRDGLLMRIRRALEPDGLLVISEKVRFEDPTQEAFYDSAHLAYKRANGYSELEISQKRTALENVMILDSERVHRDRFAAAGFGTVTKWFACLNWVSYLVYCR